MSTTKTKNRVLIAITCTLFLSILFYAGFLSNIQLKLSDNLYGGKTALNSIIIVAIDDNSLQEIGRWPWNRTVFAETITKLNQSRTIAIDVAFFEATEEDKILGEALSEKTIIPAEYTSFSRENGKVTGKKMLKPAPGLEKAQTGYVNIITDSDGVTRAANMDISEEYDNFAYAAYKQYWKKEAEKPARFLINFAGPPESYKYYSFTDVYNDRISPEEFKDKLVLIGATSPDMHDDYFVPTSKGKAMPGVEIHANTIQTLINKDLLSEQPRWTVVLAMLISAIIISLLIKFGIRITTIAVPVLIIGYLFFSIYSFNYGIIMNIVYVPVSILFTYTFEVIYSYHTEKKEREKTLGAFSKYVSPEVINEIMKDPKKLKLGGEKEEITIFFSDIRGFTTISESLTPEKLVHLLNEYLTAMTDIAMKNDGVVDKYIGDAIMAFWGAPIKKTNHAELACLTSLEMIKKLKELNKKWTSEGFPEIKIGIGLNTGHAVIGNMGSYERFNYTAMGDTINLGSRLEGLTKAYGVSIIISEFTHKEINEKFATRKLDLVAVKGKKKPIYIYELICKKEELKEKEKIEIYEKGLSLYLSQKWEEAIKQFEKVDDFASKEFIQRCKTFKKEPPANWDGAWVMKTK